MAIKFEVWFTEKKIPFLLNCAVQDSYLKKCPTHPSVK